MLRDDRASLVARRFPSARGAGRIHPQTVVRWIQRGVKAASGRRVKLEAVRVGGRWLTSRGAVARFVAALTAAADPVPAAPPSTPRTPAARQRAAEQAAAALKKMGA